MLDVPLETTMESIERCGFDDEDPDLMRSFGLELRTIASLRGFVVLKGDRTRQEVHDDVWLAHRSRLEHQPLVSLQ